MNSCFNQGKKKSDFFSKREVRPFQAQSNCFPCIWREKIILHTDKLYLQILETDNKKHVPMIVNELQMFNLNCCVYNFTLDSLSVSEAVHGVPTSVLHSATNQA